MTTLSRSAKWLALSLSVVFFAAACSSPAPSSNQAAEPQPAATEAQPAEPLPTEAPAAAEPTVAPVVEEPTAAPVAEEPTTAPAATEAPAASGGVRTFTVVPGDSKASYEVDEEFLSGAANALGINPGKTKTIGTSDQVSGQFTVDFSGAAPAVTAGEFQVDISALKSDQNRRDNRIRNDWLESARFPIATFKVTGIQNAPASYTEGAEASFQMAGDLTIREITQPVVFDVQATLSGSDITGTATTSFLMSDFGVDPPAMGDLFTVGDNTVVTVTFVASE